MERIDYWGAFRRRWYVLIVAIAVGAAGGWFARPLETPQPTRYEAGTAILGSSNPGVTNLATLSALARLGEVPERVANALDYEGDPLDLAAQITTTPDQATGILWIIATAESADRAELLADTFARQLVKWVVRTGTETSLAEAEFLSAQIDRLADAIADLEAEIRTTPIAESSLLVAERDAKIRRYGVLVEQFDQISNAPRPSSISVLQRARANEIAPSSEYLSSIPPITRAIAGGVIGLLAGLALVLVLERTDRRIRTRGAAERSFGLSVVAEIPVPRRKRRAIVYKDGRVSPGVAPLRLLGAMLSQASLLPGSKAGRNGSRGAQTILVTSPEPSEGKTYVAASLAAALAESGKRVIVLSCDFRRPLIHRLFEVTNEEGLSDALRSGNGRGMLNSVGRSTGLPNLVVVPSGSRAENPAELLSSERMGRALDEAREAADVVLLDTPAILSDGDAVSLLDEADSVLVVARAGKTTIDEARRTAEVLERLEAPVAGVALTGGA